MEMEVLYLNAREEEIGENQRRRRSTALPRKKRGRLGSSTVVRKRVLGGVWSSAFTRFLVLWKEKTRKNRLKAELQT